MASNPPYTNATSAVHRVLNTTELLEAILLNLNTNKAAGMRTLLLSQRVNSMFHNTITNSLPLQQALWFQPPNKPTTRRKLNPLLFFVHIERMSTVDPRAGAPPPTNTSKAVEFIRMDVNAVKLPPGSWRVMAMTRGFQGGVIGVRPWFRWTNVGSFRSDARNTGGWVDKLNDLIESGQVRNE